MTSVLFTAWLAAAQAGTIYGVERVGASFNWFAYDVDTGTRSVLGPFNADVDPSRPGDLAWDPNAGEMTYIPGGPFYRDMYVLDLHTGAETYVDTYAPELNNILWDTAGSYLYGLNLGGASGLVYYYNPVTGFSSFQPYTNTSTRAATMIGLSLMLAVDPATGDVYENDLGTGVEHLAGNLTIAPGVIRGLTYDLGANQILMVDGAGTLYELDSHRAYAASELNIGLGNVWAMEVVPRSLFVSPTVVDYGSCPGVDPILIRDMTPGGSVAILTGTTGFSSIPAGSCTGTLLPIRGARLVSTLRANAIGEISVSPNLPANVCGKKLMAVDLTTCLITNATTL